MATLNKEKEDNKVEKEEKEEKEENNEEIINLLINDKQFKTAEDFKSEKETLKNKKSDSCQELKNLAYKTMLLNGNDILQKNDNIGENVPKKTYTFTIPPTFGMDVSTQKKVTKEELTKLLNNKIRRTQLPYKEHFRNLKNKLNKGENLTNGDLTTIRFSSKGILKGGSKK